MKGPDNHSTALGTGIPAPNYDPRTGLAPAIVQDTRSGRVLMLGYMNGEALAASRKTGRVTFFSRRRGRLWTKGETSGNWLEVKEILLDCDGDALLVRAIAHGPTCHTGAVSCFDEPERWSLGEILADLYEVIASRVSERPEGSYTAELLDGGHSKIVRKVAEEAVELGLELIESGDHVADEASDLLYHMLVLLYAAKVHPDDVAATLRARRR